MGQIILHCEKGNIYEGIDSSGGYDKSFATILKCVGSNRKPLSDEQLLMPVKVLGAIEKSVRTGKKVGS